MKLPVPGQACNAHMITRTVLSMEANCSCSYDCYVKISCYYGFMIVSSATLLANSILGMTRIVVMVTKHTFIIALIPKP